MDVLERARRYVAKCPPAVSGQGGHDQAFTVATALAHGFCLDLAQVHSLMTEYNARCVPPWSEHELYHKCRSAIETPHNKPRGFLLGDRAQSQAPAVQWRKPMAPAPRKAPAGPPPKIATERKLPDPLANGACELLQAAFQDGEGVRIVPAVLNEDSKEVPAGHGATYSRQEWLDKLSAKGGNPNKIWRSSDRTGIYIGVNPMKIGADRDADVTAFRHVLVEFDQGLSLEEQYNLLCQSDLPITALIHSGRRSIHAWVRLDAKDRNEYAEHVKILWEHFEAYGIDSKNRNPSRLSRLPNCIRFDKRQELLAVNIGRSSFMDWLAEKEIASCGQHIGLGALLDFDADKDPNSVIGNRWLCKGAACLWIAQSGVGKSSMAMQAMLMWALARPFFGVVPATELKSLLIQHENDIGDLSEMLKGVLLGMKVPIEPEVGKTLERNIVIIRERTHTGPAFVEIAQRLIERHRPHLVWLDPLYTYMGDDISSAKVCSDFLINGLGPITEAAGVVWMLMHHTGKPIADAKARKGWTTTDYSYLGIGSSVLTNYVRATVTLLKKGEDMFQMQFGKRGKRARALDLTGTPTNTVWLRHAQGRICWEQIEAPPNDGEKGESKWRNGERAVFDRDKFLASIAGEYLMYMPFLERIQEFGRCQERKAKSIFTELKPSLIFDRENRTYTYVNQQKEIDYGK